MHLQPSFRDLPGDLVCGASGLPRRLRYPVAPSRWRGLRCGHRIEVRAHHRLASSACRPPCALVETATANGVEPHGYLSLLFERLPYASSVDDFEGLLPWNTKEIQLVSRHWAVRRF